MRDCFDNNPPTLRIATKIDNPRTRGWLQHDFKEPPLENDVLLAYVCYCGGLLRVQKPKWAKSFKVCFGASLGHCCQGTFRGTLVIRLFRSTIYLSAPRTGGNWICNAREVF